MGYQFESEVRSALSMAAIMVIDAIDGLGIEAKTRTLAGVQNRDAQQFASLVPKDEVVLGEY